MMSRLWRHSLAVSIAARSLARDAGDPDPAAVARAGLLCRLGCWAALSVDPDWFLRWWQDESKSLRRTASLPISGPSSTTLDVGWQSTGDATPW